jgi:maltose O-acetyltransferase
MSFSYLWQRRERPALFSRRFAIVWAKRFLNLPALCRAEWRNWRLKWRGAHIGTLTVIEKSRLEGDLHRLTIGSESVIGEGVRLMLHDNVSIGSRVVINADVTILTASHALRDSHWSTYCRPVWIEDYAWVATGAMLLPGVRVGRGAVVAAGAVVRSDVPDYALAIGNPAAIAKQLREPKLDYSPVRLLATFEAWLGKPSTRVPVHHASPMAPERS